MNAGLFLPRGGWSPHLLLGRPERLCFFLVNKVAKEERKFAVY
jgi:hypothetical protein